MHRAEKSSSKICRSREVERAQELHRRKITGVKSYLSTVISKPSIARPSGTFRRSQHSQAAADDGDQDGPEPDFHPSAGSLLSSSPSGQELDAATEVKVEQWFAKKQEDVPTAKLDEPRGAAPLAHPSNGRKAPPPPAAPPHKKSLNSTMRARQLREIEVLNVGLSERIKKTAPHYRNDELRRDWQQNVSYLSSICEFPMAKELISPRQLAHSLQTGQPLANTDDADDEDLSFLEGKHFSISAATAKVSGRADGCLPSIHTPGRVHPIKAIPTSPRKAQLNLAPAYRSLRKAMPQQPALPPISSPTRVNEVPVSAAVNTLGSEAAASPRDGTVTKAGKSDVIVSDEPSRPMPSRQASAVGSTAFIGDLQDSEGQPEAAGDLKYQLLKTGRFVGGSYLVLTVFCGDGVRNPYGFDVYAFHRELHCEYKLSVTREMAHELIETSSSSSMVAETEAAAGTNWSMQQIARSICDHVQFTALEGGQGEVLFLIASVKAASPSMSRSLLIDTNPNLMAVCVHQVVELDQGSNAGIAEDDDGASARRRQPRGLVGKKRKLHVFASTCPPKAVASGSVLPGHYDRDNQVGRESVRFEVFGSIPSPRTSTSSTRCNLQCAEDALEIDMSVDELYLVLDRDGARLEDRRVSLERLIASAVRHLHIISVPGSGDSSEDIVHETLILNARMNPSLGVCSNQPVVGSSASSLQRKRSRKQFLSQDTVFPEPTHPSVLVQTGLMWRDTYLLVHVAVVDEAQSGHQTAGVPWRRRRRLIQDVSENVAVHVFNPMSGLHSERLLRPEDVDTMLESLGRLDALQDTGSNFMDVLTFSKALLSRLQLDADLFGAQVIVFPELEVRATAATSGSCSSASPKSKRSPERKRPIRVVEDDKYPIETRAAVVLQAHFRGYLCRKIGLLDKVREASDGDMNFEDDGEVNIDEDAAIENEFDNDYESENESFQPDIDTNKLPEDEICDEAEMNKKSIDEALQPDVVPSKPAEIECRDETEIGEDETEVGKDEVGETLEPGTDPSTLSQSENCNEIEEEAETAYADALELDTDPDMVADTEYSDEPVEDHKEESGAIDATVALDTDPFDSEYCDESETSRNENEAVDEAANREVDPDKASESKNCDATETHEEGEDEAHVEVVESDINPDKPSESDYCDEVEIDNEAAQCSEATRSRRNGGKFDGSFCLQLERASTKIVARIASLGQLEVDHFSC